MRYAIRKAVIRFVFLEVVTAVVFSVVAYNATDDAYTLSRFVAALGDLYVATLPLQAIYVFEAFHRFGRSYWGPTPSDSARGVSDDTDSRSPKTAWPTANQREFNSNGNIMLDSNVDVMGHMRGDTHQ